MAGPSPVKFGRKCQKVKHKATVPPLPILTPLTRSDFEIIQLNDAIGGANGDDVVLLMVAAIPAGVPKPDSGGENRGA